MPGLIVGEPVPTRAGVFELYYLFPLTAEADTIALVQRTVLLAGLGLVLLVAADRAARHPAGRAAGPGGRADRRAARRRRPRPADARSAATTTSPGSGRSFNDMAGSLQRQIRRLEELSRLQRRFTSDVSHELRTPLTTIRMAAELLHAERDEFPPELRAVGRAAARRARPVRVAAGRPAGDQRATTPASPTSSPSASISAAWSAPRSTRARCSRSGTAAS